MTCTHTAAIYTAVQIQKSFHVKWLCFLWSLFLLDIQPDASQLQASGRLEVRTEPSTSPENLKNCCCFLFLLLFHRKTWTLCKVRYTPMVPCCPEMNSGNYFQWEWTIRNNRDLSGVVLWFCSFVCPISSVGRKWSWESVRETKTLREIVFDGSGQIVRSTCSNSHSLHEWVHNGTHPEEICFQSAY